MSWLPVKELDLPKRFAARGAEILFFAGEATVFDTQTGTILARWKAACALPAKCFA